MASTSRGSSNNSLVLEQFCTVTGSDRAKATGLLEICNWNLEMAVNLYWDGYTPSNGLNKETISSDICANSNAQSDDEHINVVDDEIRAPIPQVRAVLVDNDVSAHYDLRGGRRRSRSVFDGFRDFQAEAKWQEELQSDSLSSSSAKKLKTLEDLFRPPLDIIYRGSFESAREYGRSSNKWLMVNIQDSREFACQVLNRDVWSNAEVKKIVSQNFIFWQVYCDSVEGQRYMQFYHPVNFPYIAVIDPRTGEKIVEWNKMDTNTFCQVVPAFLSERSILDDSFSHSKSDHINIMNLTEEEQIKAAIDASLKEAHDDDDNDSECETFDSDSESQNNEVNYKSDSNQSKRVDEDWKLFLGSNNDEKTYLILRLPNGKRECITWPYSTQIKALWLYCEFLGFTCDTYELVTNFPRKNLSQMPPTKTLRELGLFPREMIFVQFKRSSYF